LLLATTSARNDAAPTRMFGTTAKAAE